MCVLSVGLLGVRFELPVTVGAGGRLVSERPGVGKIWREIWREKDEVVTERVKWNWERGRMGYILVRGDVD